MTEKDSLVCTKDGVGTRIKRVKLKRMKKS